jgi:predicted transcriptional regulator
VAGVTMSERGYVCVPYLQNTAFTTMKNTFEKSDFIDNMYFVTATFSEDGRAYFPSRSNTYLLARFKDRSQIMSEVEKCDQDTPTFVFTKNDEFFERLEDDNLNLLSFYYLENSDSDSDLSELGNIVAKRDRVRRAEMGDLKLSTTQPKKFTFPYEKNLIVLEVSSDNKHQADNKYCEKTRKEVQRKGIGMTNLLNLSVIEKIK